MKRNIVIIAVFCLLIITCSANAELFPSFETSASEHAPSYGGMMNIDMDSVDTLADGRQAVSYFDVSYDSYMAFGSYLGALGFELLSSDVNQEKKTASLEVSDGLYNICVEYNLNEKKMVCIYDKGVDFQKKELFLGYSRIHLNEAIKIPGLGQFTFNRIDLDGEYAVCSYFVTYLSDDDRHNYDETDSIYNKTVNNMLQFTFTNRSSSDKEFSMAKNDLFSAKLVYANADGEYAFDTEDFGTYHQKFRTLCTSSKELSDLGKFKLYNSSSAKPLASMNCGVSFALTDGLRYSTDGIIGIMLDFTTGDKYVLMLRE